MLVPFTLPARSNPAAIKRKKIEMTRLERETEGSFVIGS